MSVVTRFAPSPTGYLHIGGARTALFNWLFAKHHGGQFLLRIEDTDRARSNDDAVRAIYEGLKWLGLDWDGDAVSQYARADRHREVVEQLLAAGDAYRCYCTPAELQEMRDKARAEGRRIGYDGRWRDRDPSDAPAGVDPAIRLKAPKDGDTVVEDKVQGTVTAPNSELDDMILLRADGSPTYMLAVVVDDHDLGITHVIRGDDHLTNTFRQTQIYNAMGWDKPSFAHIPLIHGPDGAKLSKRHGALGVEAYRDMGLLPEALRNYLLRLGWGHGDEEIIPTERAIELFDLDGVGRSPARFDMVKLNNLNGHYIREADDSDLVDATRPLLENAIERVLTEPEAAGLVAIMPMVKQRAKTLLEIVDLVAFLTVSRPINLDEKAAAQLDDDGRATLRHVRTALDDLGSWSGGDIEAVVRTAAEALDVKLGKVAQPLRAALTGTTVSPPIFDVMAILGRDETLARLDDVLV
ncbi:MAG: glutamate--tRNA ligase [Rhodospirillales bacterium]